LVERHRENGLREFVTDPSDCFRAVPAIHFLGAANPVGDNVVVEAACDNRIVRQIEQARLLAQSRLRRYALQREKGCRPDRRDADSRFDCCLG
jgi:hypothetical protein